MHQSSLEAASKEVKGQLACLAKVSHHSQVLHVQRVTSVGNDTRRSLLSQRIDNIPAKKPRASEHRRYQAGHLQGRTPVSQDVVAIGNQSSFRQVCFIASTSGI